MPSKFHPALRISAVLADTLWAMGRLSLSRNPHTILSPWCQRLLRHLRVEVRVEGALPAGGQLWVANHLSWLDPMVLMSLRPSGLLAKREVADYPVVGRGVRKAGVRFVRREDPSNRATALMGLRSELAAGRNFLLFPEGTTTVGEGLAPLYKGGLRLAYRMQVPVLTLNLASEHAYYPWVGDDELLSHIGGLCRRPSTVVRVRPGAVIHPREFATEAAWVEGIREGIHPRQVIEDCA